MPSYEEDPPALHETLQLIHPPHCAMPGKHKSVGMNGRASKLCLHQNNGGNPIQPTCNVLSYKGVLKYF